MSADAQVPARPTAPGRAARWAFRGLVFVLALTGFGQLPIYNRYYLSDLPGCGWLADYWATRLVHYLAAALFLALLAHAATLYLAARRPRRLRLSRSGALRAGLLAALVASGGLIVVKNFPGVFFSDALVIAVDLAHLGAAAAFLLAQLIALIGRRPWVEQAA